MSKSENSSLNDFDIDIDIESEIKTVSEIFRQNLKLLRVGQELSVEKLSQILQITVRRINDLESGKSIPTFEDLIKIVNHFPITFDDLLDNKIGLLIPSNQMVKDIF